MKNNTGLLLRWVAGLLLMGVGAGAWAQAIPPGTQLVRHLGMNAAYVRETTDKAWHIRFTDRVPILPGLYVIVYNERSDIVYHGEIPKGDYSPEAPFVVTVPADGVAQQYVIKILGNPLNVGVITLPMSDLPYEVYDGADRRGNTLFSMPVAGSGEILRYAFQVKPGVEKVSLMALGSMRVLDRDGAVLAESRAVPNPVAAPKGQKVPPPEATLDMKTQAGRVYWVDPMKSWKVECPKGSEKIYLTLDPEKWFSPNLPWDLNSRPWWKGLFKP